MISDWQSTITRPDLADWVTVAAYLVAAYLSALAAGHAGLKGLEPDRRFWRIASVLLILLAINELLDLQTLLTTVGRTHAKMNGWYEARRGVQYIFVAALVGAAACAGIALWLLTRRTNWAVRLALAGLAFIGLFVLMRAASFNRLEEILGRGSVVFNWGSLQEVAGILVVAIAAGFYTRGAPNPD